MRKSANKPLTQCERSEETRRLILETATRHFARHGFDRTSTATIAKEAGISQAIIFHYFGTKQNLFWTVVFDRADGPAEESKPYKELLKQADPAEKLRMIGQALARKAEEQPDLNEIHVRNVFTMDIANDSIEAQKIWEKVTLLEAIFEQGKKDGVFRAGVNAKIAAPTLIGIFNINYLRWNMLGRKGSLQETIREAFEMFISGVLESSTK